jgi:hypothetical protein
MFTVIDHRTVALDAEATIHFAQELKAEVTLALARLPGPFVVRADRLEALDLVGAQILLSLRSTLAPGRVTFQGWPAPIAAFLATCGLQPHFA